MKLWINLGIVSLFMLSFYALDAQDIFINDQGIQAFLKLDCDVQGKKIPVRGNTLSIPVQFVDNEASLKISFQGVNAGSLPSVTVRLKQTSVNRSIRVNEFEPFYANINPGGGTWTFAIYDNKTSLLKEQSFHYSISGSEPKVSNKNDPEKEEVTIDSAAIIWDQIHKSQNIAVFKEFGKRFRRSNYAALAKKAILQLTPISVTRYSQQENEHTLEVFPILGKKTFALLEGDTFHLDFKQVPGKPYCFKTRLLLPESKKYRLEFFDLSANGQKNLVVELNNTFQIEELGEGRTRAVKVIGGQPPYQVQFTQNNTVHKAIQLPANPWPISFEILQSILPSGEFNIKLRDAHLNSSVSIDAGSITIPEKKAGLNWRKWVPYALAVLFLLLLLILINNARKRRHQKKVEANKSQLIQKLEEKALELEQKPNVPDPATQIEMPPTATEPLQIQPSDVTLSEGSTTKTFVIKPKASAEAEKLDESTYFNTIMQSHVYRMVPLSKLWPNSAISHIYFNPESLASLDEFLQKGNLSLIETRGANIPEIGGMLLGRFAYDPQKESYQVGIEKFVPIQARFQNVYQLAFDALSIASEVSKITDEFPELRIMGWFHTHPGHGLFLSNQDLEIQEHYREPYHFAMEIDSLSTNLDTAFFTRTKEGKINNYNDLIPGASWFSWYKLCDRN